MIQVTSSHALLQRYNEAICSTLCKTPDVFSHALLSLRLQVVNSQAEYEERAVLLGTNRALRETLRARLESSRLTSPLFDTEGWVRNLEKVYFRMWDIHIEGKGPRSFEIPA